MSAVTRNFIDFVSKIEAPAERLRLFHTQLERAYHEDHLASHNLEVLWTALENDRDAWFCNWQTQAELQRAYQEIWERVDLTRKQRRKGEESLNRIRQLSSNTPGQNWAILIPSDGIPANSYAAREAAQTAAYAQNSGCSAEDVLREVQKQCVKRTEMDPLSLPDPKNFKGADYIKVRKLIREALTQAPQQKPLQQQAIQPAPLQQQPVQPAPLQQQPVQPAPLQQQPVQPAPLQQQPVQPVPAQQQSSQLQSSQQQPAQQPKTPMQSQQQAPITPQTQPQAKIQAPITPQAKPWTPSTPQAQLDAEVQAFITPQSQPQSSQQQAPQQSSGAYISGEQDPFLNDLYDDEPNDQNDPDDHDDYDGPTDNEAEADIAGACQACNGQGESCYVCRRGIQAHKGRKQQQGNQGENIQGQQQQPKAGNAKSKCQCSQQLLTLANTPQRTRGRLRRAQTPRDRFILCKAIVDAYTRQESVCNPHIRHFAQLSKLTTRKVSSSDLANRIQQIGRSTDDGWGLMTGDGTYKWFDAASRPTHPTELRGVYKYDPLPIAQFALDRKQLAEQFELRYEVDVYATFLDQATINLPLFSWWWSQDYAFHMDGEVYTIGELVGIEFNTYNWHFRHEDAAVGQRGWLRNMYHGISQQLMRMDPEYYRLTVLLRPDNAWRLISYPYYTKYAAAEDSMAFRQVDINLAEYLRTGKGGSLLQSLLSLNDEEDGCTELVVGFNSREKVKKWFDAACARAGRQVLNSPAVDLTQPDLWGADEETNFGSFTPVPCQKGEVRVTLPIVPYGLRDIRENSKVQVRRTMSPGFVAIDDDHQTMEIPEMETWADISQAHANHMPLGHQPSGAPNVYADMIPYPFQGTCKLRLAGHPLSEALLGRERWDNPAVCKARNLILGPDIQAYEAYLHSYRKQAAEAFCRAMVHIRDAESEVYGPKSYFFRGDDGTAPPAPPADNSMTGAIMAQLEARNRYWQQYKPQEAPET